MAAVEKLNVAPTERFQGKVGKLVKKFLEKLIKKTKQHCVRKEMDTPI